MEASELAILAGMLAGFFAIAKVMLAQASKDRDSDRDERKLFALAIERMAASSTEVASTNQEIANAVKKQARESEKRNGHLGELIVNQGKQTQKIADMAVEKIITGVEVQHINRQEVEHQHIVSKED